jgi:hypothetical protein
MNAWFDVSRLIFGITIMYHPWVLEEDLLPWGRGCITSCGAMV